MLEDFITKNIDKKIVVVQGLGFVGAVMAIVVANSDNNEYAVIGVDLPHRQDVIDKLNSGEFPIQSTDKKVDIFFKEALKRGNFYATSDVTAYEMADVVIVDINLDVAKSTGSEGDLNGYDVDLSNFKKAIRTVSSRCKSDVLLLVETTVPPGTCEKVVMPIFAEEFAKRRLPMNYKIGHSYERVMPGPGYIDSIKNFYRVYSGIDERSAEEVKKFLETIISTDKYPLTKLSNTTATEMSKVLENSFRAMNIAFIQEWTQFAEVAGVNLYEVVDAIRMRPTHANIMRPGLGVGGYCLTKDPLLASWASENLFNSESLPQSEIAVQINDRMPLHTFDIIMRSFKGNLRNKRILIGGVSYLADVGDTRYSPVELLFKKLKEQGAELYVQDPYVPYWQEQDIEVDQGLTLFEERFDLVVIGCPHKIYFDLNLIDKVLQRNLNCILVDPHGVYNYDSLDAKLKKTNIEIIGRGDV